MKALIIPALVCLPLLGSGQQLRQVIASTGGFGVGSSIQASSTIGEIVVTTGSSNTTIATQGFQQAERKSTVSIIEQTSEVRINAYPNPTNGRLTLKMEGYESQALTLTIYDMKGRAIRAPKSMKPAGPVSNLEIDLTSEQSGYYLLHLVNDAGSHAESLRIIKL